jgi:hypothetical protein
MIIIIIIVTVIVIISNYRNTIVSDAQIDVGLAPQVREQLLEFSP